MIYNHIKQIYTIIYFKHNVTRNRYRSFSKGLFAPALKSCIFFLFLFKRFKYRNMRILFILLSCFIGFPLAAQTLQGVVLETGTQKPIQGASIFFHGTSFYCITDEQGHFSLTIPQKINTPLIISHVSYQPLSYPYPYNNLPDSLFMQEKVMDLQAVVVSIDVFSRKLKMNAFRRHFLGETIAGKSCTILNEDDIQVSFNPHDNTLRAFCDAPIIIYNAYLQYTMQYHLRDFFIQYTRKTLSDKYMIRYRIDGSCIFTDEAPEDPSAAKRRRITYERSYAAFFYDLVHGKINQGRSESSFRALGINSKVIDIAATHHLTDSLNLHAVHVDFPPEIQRDTIDRLGRKIYGQMLVTFKNRIYSVINYYKPSFLIDDFGNFDSGSGIFFEGDMAIQRIGNMLPYNYRPPTR